MKLLNAIAGSPNQRLTQPLAFPSVGEIRIEFYGPIDKSLCRREVAQYVRDCPASLCQCDAIVVPYTRNYSPESGDFVPLACNVLC